MGKFKKILFQDVENPNESADGPITLRISALVMMIYLLIISVTLVMVHHVWWMAGNLLFVAIYGYLLYLTYENHTRTALILYNIVMLGAVCFNVMLIGWDSGLQHFLFTLVLLDLLFTYLSKWSQGVVVMGLCAARLGLYFFCRGHGKIVQIEGACDIFLQVLTTVVVFVLLYLSGLMLSKDSQAVERKLMKYNNELQQAANTDTLTKLWNRHYLMHYMGKRWSIRMIFCPLPSGILIF